MKGRNNTRWILLAGLVIAGLAAAWYWHSQSTSTAAPGGQQRQAGRDARPFPCAGSGRHRHP